MTSPEILEKLSRRLLPKVAISSWGWLSSNDGKGGKVSNDLSALFGSGSFAAAWHSLLPRLTASRRGDEGRGRALPLGSADLL